MAPKEPKTIKMPQFHMKTKIPKSVWYVASAGAAGATVLVTVSSVGWSKTMAEAFPNMGGLLQERPQILESLLTPEEPPVKPQPPAAAAPLPPAPPQAPANPATPDPNAVQAGDNTQNPQQTSQSPSATGSQSGVSGGSVGGMDCTADNLSSFSLDTSNLIALAPTTQSLSVCLPKLLPST